LYTSEETSNEIVGIAELVRWAYALVLATIGYHSSMPGSLKHFLDYFWSEVADKTFGYIDASIEKGRIVMDQMLTAALFLNSCYKWYDVKLVYLFAFFSCPL
jgi:NAD(P)H-dependent FMN reductase